MAVREIRRAVLLGGALLCLPVPAFAQQGGDLLQRVDRCRYPWPRFSMDATLLDGEIRQQWRVTVRENGDARIEGLSAKEKERVVLLLDEQMWLVLPGARRPVRISPQQRLLGPAAGGDMARFRYSVDYRLEQDSEATLEEKPVRKLELKAARKSVSYQRAVLWVTPAGVPIQSEFYYLSGKLARTVRFGPLVKAHGAMVLSGMTLEEPSGKAVEMRFEQWRPVTPDPALFRLPEAPEPRQPRTTGNRS